MNITKDAISKAASISNAAFRVSVLCDAMTMYSFMDALCIESADIAEEQGYDDNNYFSYYEISDVTFDDEKIELKGGVTYLLETLKSAFGVCELEFETLDDVKDFIQSYEFLREDPINNMADFGDIVRVNEHNQTVTLEAMANFIQKCVKDIVPALQSQTESLLELAA